MTPIRVAIMAVLLVTGPVGAQLTPAKAGKPMRVLLFAGGPTREYQFVRPLLLRHPDKVQLSILLQSAGADTEQGVEPLRMLKELPLLTATLPKRSEWDLVIAFDPDWSRVPTKHLQTLEHWVGEQGGGLIVVAGPIHAYQLARPGGVDLTAIIKMLPVRLKDIRLHGLGLDAENRNDGFVPRFLRVMDEKAPLMKLDDEHASARIGWDKFHWDGKVPDDAPKPPVRGFYHCYPVETPTARAQVLASVVDQKNRERPFIVSSAYGKGKVVFIASGELWRLRTVQASYHEHLWHGLAQFASGQAGLSKSTSWLAVQRHAIQGETIALEARLVDEQGVAVATRGEPMLRVTYPPGSQRKEFIAPLKARADAGWFDAAIGLPEAGEYRLTVITSDGKALATAAVNVKSLFEAEVTDGRLWQKQRELSHRSLAWSQAMLKLASRLEQAKADKGAIQEARLYRDAIDRTVDETWAEHHNKMMGAVSALSRRSLNDLMAASDESQSITKNLYAMRVRLLGADFAKNTKKFIGLLDQLTDAEGKLDFALDKTRTALARAGDQLSSIRPELTRDEALNLAVRQEQWVKNLQDCRPELKTAGDRCRALLREFQKASPRAETFRIWQDHLSAALEAFLEQDFDKSMVAHVGVQKMLEKGGFDEITVVTARRETDRACASLARLSVYPIGPLFVELAALETAQAEQTRILKGIRSLLEAELLRQLLEGK